MHRQPLEIQTLYSELLERLGAFEAHRAIGSAPGLFVTKTVKGQEYYYFQYSEPGGRSRQAYVGRKDAALDALVARHEAGRELSSTDRDSIQRVANLLRVGGAMLTDAPSARVLRALAEAGVFRLGAVLVGTHAFSVIGNLLGVRWEGAALRTQDIDVAADPALSIAVPHLSADVPDILTGLEMGFLPVPGLDPANPSTSFMVRGQGLRVDLLAPAQRESGRPVAVPRLGAAAQPLKFLDYVMATPVTAAIVDGGGISVNVPDPVRFAFHKLIVAAERSVTFAAKRQKDLSQAGQVFEVLVEDRPGDVERGWTEIRARGTGWSRRVEQSLRALEELSPQVAARVREAELRT